MSVKVTIYHKGEVQTREVNKESFTVGRFLDCDIHLNDAGISRVHVTASLRENKIWIEDKNSANGTFINGVEIQKGVFIPVSSEDQIQLGKTEYAISISTMFATISKEAQLKAPTAEAPNLAPLVQPAKIPSAPVETITQLPNEIPQSKEELAEKLSFSAEKLLHEAKRKSTQILLEAEAQAERKAQSIYEKAHLRLAQAHQEADVLLVDFQRQGQELLGETRKVADKMREDVDGYIESLRKKAKTESDEILAEAQQQAIRIKAEALQIGNENANKTAEGLISHAQEEAAKIVKMARQQTVELEEVQKELASKQAVLVETTRQVEQAKENLNQQEANLSEIRSSNENLSKQKQSLQEALVLLQNEQVKLSARVQELELKKDQLLKETEEKKIFLIETFEKQKIQFEKQEEQREEKMRLELVKKIEKFEEDLIEDIFRRRTSVVREVHNAVEKTVVQIVEATKWRRISAAVEQRIYQAFDGKMASISKSLIRSQGPLDLRKRKKDDNIRWASLGLVLGLLLFFTGQILLERVRENQSPLGTRAKSEAIQRQADLESRRYSPTQTDELKETYVDAVIYTRRFTEISMDQNYQQRLYKAASGYLLKTWRLDEDKSLQVLATAKALVRELSEKKNKIHPDFVKDGLEKMRNLEKETLVRMKDILGSEVRLESFRRFERNFFVEFVASSAVQK